MLNHATPFLVAITHSIDSTVPPTKRKGSKKPPPKVGGRLVPNCYLPAHAFILTGDTNREWEAYLAYKGTIPWGHSIPLSAVVSYLKWRGTP